MERWSAHGLGVDERLLTAAVTDLGEILAPEVAELLWELAGELAGDPGQAAPEGDLALALDDQASLQVGRLREAQARLLDEESDKLSRWAEDCKQGLRLELDRLDEEIKALQREVRQVAGLEDKLALRRRERDLDRQRTEKRQALYETQDRIDAERNRLLDDVEAALQGRVERQRIFAVRWTIPAASDVLALD